MRLAGRNAIVTGAASGIGRETALRFAEEGAAVVCADLNAEGAAAVAASIVANGAVAAAVSVDITNEREVARLAEEALAALGRIDVLVNNAGVTILGGVAELAEADWQREIDINLSGAYRVSKAFWPHFAAAGGGAILSTASIAGVVGVRQDAAYVASKAGLIMLTRCMALDGAPHGIRANCICPGFVDTPMFQDYLAEQPVPDAALARAAGRTPLGHIGTPRDIADGFVYLASDDARWITGTALVIDGGLTAGLTE
ncbi:MAG: SDR family NAD(P)-dependent oxidoreductase [Rhodospirillaceae bacterium]|nr:SDR family NAD(P)-dependent oxidoreductase [Rhodospirillaceae bacterium]